MAVTERITYHAILLGKSVQSYSQYGVVAFDFNGSERSGGFQEWTPAEARTIIRLLTLAIADAELEL